MLVCTWVWESMVASMKSLYYFMSEQADEPPPRTNDEIPRVMTVTGLLASRL